MGFIYLHDSSHEHMIVRFYVLVIIDMYITYYMYTGIHYIYTMNHSLFHVWQSMSRVIFAQIKYM